MFTYNYYSLIIIILLYDISASISVLLIQRL